MKVDPELVARLTPAASPAWIELQRRIYQAGIEEMRQSLKRMMEPAESR